MLMELRGRAREVCSSRDSAKQFNEASPTLAQPTKGKQPAVETLRAFSKEVNTLITQRYYFIFFAVCFTALTTDAPIDDRSATEPVSSSRRCCFDFTT